MYTFRPSSLELKTVSIFLNPIFEKSILISSNRVLSTISHNFIFIGIFIVELYVKIIRFWLRKHFKSKIIFVNIIKYPACTRSII